MVTPTNNLYAPPKSAVADLVSDGDAELASRGSRLGAKIIDGLVIGLPLAPAYVRALPSIMSAAKTAGRPNMSPLVAWAAIGQTGMPFYIGSLIVMCLLAVTAVLVHRNGQTIGKKALKIKIVRKDGSRATLGRIFSLRYLVSTLITMIPAVGGLYGLVDILFIFGKPQRCIHDYIADTIVVKA
jgi:uncharacterized RDD family membrane protein YckC